MSKNKESEPKTETPEAMQEALQGAPAQETAARQINWDSILKSDRPTLRLKQNLLFGFITRFKGNAAQECEIDFLRRVFGLIDEYEALFR